MKLEMYLNQTPWKSILGCLQAWDMFQNKDKLKGGNSLEKEMATHSSVLYIPKYFILSISMVNEIVSLISLSVFSLLVYRTPQLEKSPCISKDPAQPKKKKKFQKPSENSIYWTNNEKTESEIKETISFTIEMERIKYLGIYLPIRDHEDKQELL